MMAVTFAAKVTDGKIEIPSLAVGGKGVGGRKKLGHLH
jgi:hypothetical protein